LGEIEKTSRLSMNFPRLCQKQSGIGGGSFLNLENQRWKPRTKKVYETQKTNH
jgi:hypothetical protein